MLERFEQPNCASYFQGSECLRTSDCQGQEGGGNGEMLAKSTKWNLGRVNESRNLTYGMMTIVNIIVLNIENC